MWKGVRIGAVVGASAGALFGLAVVLFADCAGPDCTRERIFGILAHAGIGTPIGAALGLAGASAAGLLRRRAGWGSPRR